MTVERLSKEHAAWYHSEVILRASGWFPTDALFDVKRVKGLGRYVPKAEVPSANIGGNMGSSAVGCSLADLPAAKRLLEAHGCRVLDPERDVMLKAENYQESTNTELT